LALSSRGCDFVSASGAFHRLLTRNVTPIADGTVRWNPEPIHLTEINFKRIPNRIRSLDGFPERFLICHGYCRQSWKHLRWQIGRCFLAVGPLVFGPLALEVSRQTRTSARSPQPGDMHHHGRRRRFPHQQGWLHPRGHRQLHAQGDR
jgi:hypothetical protein